MSFFQKVVVLFGRRTESCSLGVFPLIGWILSLLIAALLPKIACLRGDGPAHVYVE